VLPNKSRNQGDRQRKLSARNKKQILSDGGILFNINNIFY